MHTLTALFVFLSGLTALIYEIGWVRLLSYNIGSDTTAISMVLSAFFLGMALGSYALSRIARDYQLNIKFYIIIEASVGISALCLLPILTNLDVFVESFPVFATSLVGKFLLAHVLLLLPTLCLGASFPLLAALLIQSQETLGKQLAQLYSINLIGAIIGAIATGFLLIPYLGLDGSMYFAACINFFIAGLAWYKRSIYPTLPVKSRELIPYANQTYDKTEAQKRSLAILAACLSGFVLLACEIAWTRYFSFVTDSSLYSFCLILAATLSGIALGSWIVRKIPTENLNLNSLLVKLFLVLACALLLQKQALSYLPELMNKINHLDGTPYYRQNIRYLMVFMFLIPVTTLFGLLFPLAMRLYVPHFSWVKTHVSRVYAVNTLACIAGSLIAGLWIAPVFGTDILLKILIAILLVLPLVYMFQNYIDAPINSIASVLLLILIINVTSSPVNYQKMNEAVDFRFKNDKQQTKQEPHYYFLEEGKNSVISLLSYNEKYAILQSNGLQESLIALNEYIPPLTFETLQAYLPYFIHKDPKSAFVLGYGGGNTTQALVDTDVARIDIVEIEPEIVNAVKTIENGPADALRDERVNISYGDARTALLVSDDKYDIITSQPSHPWLSGSANILTQDFFTIVKNHLHDDGIMSQWLPLFRMDTSTLKSILKAFYEVFPHGFVLQTSETNELMLIGALSPITFDYQHILDKMQREPIAHRMQQLRIFQPEDLLWFFQLSRNEVMQTMQNVHSNTDLNLISEVQLAARFGNGEGNEDPFTFTAETAQFDVLPFFTNNETTRTLLFSAGKKFLQWYAPEKTQKVVNQLRSIDDLWGRSLLHEMYIWQMNYTQANELYRTSNEWLDINHYRQFQMLLRSQKLFASQAMIAKVYSPALQQLMHAQVLYHEKEWQKLAAIRPLSTEVQRWQLIGQIKLGDQSAIQELASISTFNYENIEQLKFLLSAYKNNNDLKKANWLTKQINNQQQHRINIYRSLLETANAHQNSSWVTMLQKSINQLESEMEQSVFYSSNQG